MSFSKAVNMSKILAPSEELYSFRMTHTHFFLVNHKISACIPSLGSKRLQLSIITESKAMYLVKLNMRTALSKNWWEDSIFLALPRNRAFSCQVLHGSWRHACGINEPGDVQSNDSQPEDEHSIPKVCTNLGSTKEGVKSWCCLKSAEVQDTAILKALLATKSIMWLVSLQNRTGSKWV